MIFILEYFPSNAAGMWAKLGVAVFVAPARSSSHFISLFVRLSEKAAFVPVV